MVEIGIPPMVPLLDLSMLGITFGVVRCQLAQRLVNRRPIWYVPIWPPLLISAVVPRQALSALVARPAPSVAAAEALIGTRSG